MALILHLETATEVCSVCLSKNGKVISLKESSVANSHSSILTILIQNAFNEVAFSINEIDAVAVSEGPGSYTGLRIGVSIAKGLCYSLDKPLISIPTLKAMVIGVQEKVKGENILYCPMIDARRMEVYAALYNSQLKEILAPKPKIIDAKTFDSLPSNRKIVFFGSGASKCKLLLDSSNAIFIDTFQNSASHMIDLAEEYLTDKKFSDIAYYEPAYLKKFIPFKN